MAPERRSPKLLRVADDSFAALVRAFMAPENPRWKGYADATRDAWGRELQLAAHPDVLGAVSIDTIKPSMVQAFLDGLAGRPGKQMNALAALKQLERWAIVRDLLPRQMTLGVETERPRSGHIPWTADQVATAERCARADIARMVTLAAHTGQRGSDLVKMGWADMETYKGRAGINVVQKKTGREIWIPITEPLAAALARWERQLGPILRRTDGTPWHRRALTAAWTYERDTNPALAEHKAAGLVIHGLRGHACVALYRAGANTRQVSDMVGMSEEMVANYCRFSVQRENATAAVINLDRTIREREGLTGTKSSL